MVWWYDAHWHALLLLQALLGSLVFSGSLRRRPHFRLRLISSLLAGMLLIDPLAYSLWGCGSLARMFTITILYLWLIFIFWFSYDESIWTAMFVASSGYAVQDIASSLKSIFRLFPVGKAFVATTPGALLGDLFFYGGMYLIAYLYFRPYTTRDTSDFDNRLKTVLSVAVLLICAGMARLTHDGFDVSFRSLLSESIYTALCGWLLLLVQYGTLDRRRMARSMETMQELIHQQHLQYESSRDSAELVNEKYHDLKKLLSSFRGQVSGCQLEELERSISTYDIYIHTGSDVLDVLLTEKRALCDQRGILLTCYADGHSLAFMEDLDLYSLMNNALNNAIRAAAQMPEGERIITLTVQADGAMISIHLENSCPGPVALENDLPVTDRDPRYHGFGLKSIRRIAEKYGGSLALKSQDQMFFLDILLVSPSDPDR